MQICAVMIEAVICSPWDAFNLGSRGERQRADEVGEEVMLNKGYIKIVIFEDETTII